MNIVMLQEIIWLEIHFLLINLKYILFICKIKFIIKRILFQFIG